MWEHRCSIEVKTERERERKCRVNVYDVNNYHSYVLYACSVGLADVSDGATKSGQEDVSRCLHYSSPLQPGVHDLQQATTDQHLSLARQHRRQRSSSFDE